MKQIIVLGIGNRLLRDDAIGIYIVEKLREQDTSDNISYVIGETDIDYCLDEIKEADFMIIVDAVKTGGSPGNVTVLSLDNTHYKTVSGFSSHNLHLFDMIWYFKKDLKCVLIGIEVYEIDYNIGLSQILNDRFIEIVKEVQNIITTF